VLYTAYVLLVATDTTSRRRIYGCRALIDTGVRPGPLLPFCFSLCAV